MFLSGSVYGIFDSIISLLEDADLINRCGTLSTLRTREILNA